MKRLAALLGLASAAPAMAHAGHDAIGWTLDASVTLPLLLAALFYAAGYCRIWRRAGRGRERLARSAGLYSGGWLILSGALVSPLHEAGEHSFTMHMIEHELLMLPAALLLVAARPGPVMLWGLPLSIRQLTGSIARLSLWRRLSDPVTATAIQGMVIWLWHMPSPFNLALRHEGWHIVQHLCFIAGALLFWWAMLHRSSEALAAVCLFATSMIGGALGALMALAASPWYSAYAAMGMTPLGLSPVEDQQLAGLIMWIPGGLFHLAAAMWFLARWLSGKERGHASLVE
jgi:cytochrome c oxidase assembly factor CtaG